MLSNLSVTHVLMRLLDPFAQYLDYTVLDEQSNVACHAEPGSQNAQNGCKFADNDAYFTYTHFMV